MNTLLPVAHVPSQSSPRPVPSRLGRWLLTIVLLLTYFSVQIIVAIPFVLYLMTTNPHALREPLDQVPLVVWATLIGAGIAGAATIAVAWVWPAAWRLLTHQAGLTKADWVAWSAPHHIPLWVVGLTTLPIVFAVNTVVQLALGPSDVTVQEMMFTSPARQVVASLVVSTVVPVAEELIFRGALYSALLSPRNKVDPRWFHHILPVMVTTPLFAAVHGLAGFESLPPFVAVGALALYLGLLRAATGSVKPSIVGHVVWNLSGAVALTLSNYLPIK